jgi:hypothetical protein
MAFLAEEIEALDQDIAALIAEGKRLVNSVASPPRR